MEDILAQLKNHFPSLRPNALTKIYKARAERLRLMMIMGIPADVRWLIEAKVRLSGEFANGFISYMPGLGKSSFAKKRRAKRMGVCHKCGRETCNKRCHSLGWVSVNREDKIKFIKDGLSKESLDDEFHPTSLETHPSGSVHIGIVGLWPHFKKEHKRYSLGNLTLKDPVCQFIRKLDGKHILDP